MPFFSVFLQGFAVSGGLIVAIGAQNSFVLRQGLKRDRIFLVSFICACCDAFLTIIGVNGLGAWLWTSPILIKIACWGGILFLSYFAYKSFKAAMTPSAMTLQETQTPSAKKTIVLQTLGFSLLNPHAILDTVVLLGTIGAQFPFQERQVFLAGSILASFAWFFTLGYGATRLAPLFQKPSVWKILDIGIGLMMVVIALSLLVKVL